MPNIHVFDEVAFRTSRLVTQRYSTSFSLGCRLLGPEVRRAIYAIYGFVRLADEIVDTFHAQDKPRLLAEFKAETYRSIAQGLSLNPVLHSFQAVVNQYGIRPLYIEQFFQSMEMDLADQRYDRHLYETYIVGSAEVVGLMCLQVFCNGNEDLFARLQEPARKLGAAFQKVNFLRDLRADYHELGRTYFPGLDLRHFDDRTKALIEAEIAADFQAAEAGIRSLPRGARLGVYVAFVYYLQLFKKIRSKPPTELFRARVSVPTATKLLLMLRSYFQFKLNLL